MRTTPTEQAAAYETINRYRKKAGETFHVTELEREFSFYLQQIGAKGVYLADATANKAGTFKWRGAMNKMSDLAAKGETSVLVPSQGNHLRGGVVAGRILDMTIHGVVPHSAPHAKREGAKQLWPDETKFHLHVEGGNFDEALAWTNANSKLGVLVPPYDDRLVVAGQGTLADDIHEAFQQAGTQLDHVVVPVGGGGLLAGVASRFAELDPHVTVHGVEAPGSDSLSRSIEAGHIVPATAPNKRYGGSAVQYTGKHTFDAYRSLTNIQPWSVSDDEVATVAEAYLDEIDHRNLTHTPDFRPLEPTLLVAIASLAELALKYAGETIAVVGTGRNDSLDAIWR